MSERIRLTEYKDRLKQTILKALDMHPKSVSQLILELKIQMWSWKEGQEEFSKQYRMFSNVFHDLEKRQGSHRSDLGIVVDHRAPTLPGRAIGEDTYLYYRADQEKDLEAVGVLGPLRERDTGLIQAALEEGFGDPEAMQKLILDLRQPAPRRKR